jgi:hypothetical protein
MGSTSPHTPLSQSKIERHWKELAGEAPSAYRAALLLAADPESVTFLLSRLRVVPAETPDTIRKLIGDLDHESFAMREAASAMLARLGWHAEPAVRAALPNTRSLEARSRLVKLVTSLDSCFVKDPTILRELRAIGVLRRIGTPAARALLEKLAGGAPEAMQTRAAKTALAALKQTAH